MKLLRNFTLVIILITGCNENNSNVGSQHKLNDNIEKDIPSWYNDKYQQEWRNLINAKLGLINLQEGFDSLQIRIFIECSFKPSNLIKIDISKVSNKVTLFSYLSYIDSETGFKIINVDSKELVPNSNWNLFIAKLFNTGILELPDQESLSLKNFEMPTDSDGITIELATKNYYRLYRYHSVGLNLDKEEAAKLLLALRLLEQELRFERPCEEIMK
jgi:hypothetical protein